MAGEPRQRTNPLISDMMSEPHRFGYFQTLRILQRQLEGMHGIEQAHQDMESGSLVQIRPDVSMGCPASDLSTIEFIDPVSAADERERYRITVNFLGLYGVDSPLPDYYAERFVHADEEENPQRQFLDVFHHRIYWLLYQCWRKYRYYIEYRTDGTDAFSSRFFSLIGLASEKNRLDLGFRAQKLLPYLGVLSRRVCSSQTVERVLRKLLDVPVYLLEFMPSKVRIERDQQIQLGMRNSTLGQDSTLGDTVSHLGNKFRVHIGPVDWSTYHDFQPGGHKLKVLKAALDQMLHKPLHYDLELSMRPEEEQQFCLGHNNQCGLGRATWLNAVSDVPAKAMFMEDATC